MGETGDRKRESQGRSNWNIPGGEVGGYKEILKQIVENIKLQRNIAKIQVEMDLQWYFTHPPPTFKQRVSMQCLTFSLMTLHSFFRAVHASVYADVGS